MKPRDKKIDLENALNDCMKSYIKKGITPTLKQALDNELVEGEEIDQNEPEWI